MSKIDQELQKLNLNFKKDVDLADYSTMRVHSKGAYIVETFTVNELKKLLKLINNKNLEFMVLGEGSNTVFVNDFNGIIILIKTKGKEVLEEDNKSITIKVKAGENWHEFVKYCVEKEYAGIENLALIPGTIGAAPVQNIAAYGQNITDTFESLEALDVKTLQLREFSAKECKFDYRSSAFKNELKGKYIITSVTFKLSKEFNLEASYHERKGRYGSLEEALEKIAKPPYKIKDVLSAVVNIRTVKLPSVEELGTSGSFFKNPVVHKDKFLELSKEIEDLQSYPVENLTYNIKNWKEVKDDYVKIPAGRLLDELGWKGKWQEHVGTYKNHALVVVTDGKAKPQDFIDFIDQIKASVKKAYNIDLESEVNIV